MIRVRHANQVSSLEGGDHWTPPLPETDGTYRDTPATTLHAIIAAIKGGMPWREVVAGHYRSESPWLHRIITDPCRDLFFRQYPLAPGAAVLDIGAGWGQMALPLARDHLVVAVEPTPERLSFIRAVAGQEKLEQRMICVQSDFLEVEFEPVFDVACCIGVLEWVPRFRSGPPRELQRTFLARIRQALKPTGKLVVGIENRLGLKYLLGSSDDHIGSPHIAVLDAALANKRFHAATGSELRSFTYTLAEYTQLFVEAGFTQLKAYAAFPDYKLPAYIIPANEGLEGEIAGGRLLPEEHDGSNGEPLGTAFQEDLRSHYRSLAQIGVSRYFAPSYFLEATGPGETGGN